MEEKKISKKCDFTKSKNWMFFDFGLNGGTQHYNAGMFDPKYEQWKVGEKQLVYAVYQLERCPSTGNLHVQGYIHLRDKRDKWFLIKNYSSTASFKPCRGDEFDNTKYCSKDESRVAGPWTFGDINDVTNQGERNDLTEIVKAVKDGNDFTKLITTYGDKFIKNWKSLDQLGIKLLSEQFKKVNRNIEVWWFWGAPGTGKSKLAQEMLPNAYRKDGTQWWDGYRCEDEVIIEDLNELLDRKDRDNFLKWLDIYPWQVQYKGGYIQACWTKVIVTSNHHPKQLWNAEELKRRLHKIVKFTKDGYTIDEWDSKIETKTMLDIEECKRP